MIKTSKSFKDCLKFYDTEKNSKEICKLNNFMNLCSKKKKRKNENNNTIIDFSDEETPSIEYFAVK